MDIGGPILDWSKVDMDHEFGVMTHKGVQSVRFTIDWSVAQPYADYSKVPKDQVSNYPPDENGVPTTYAFIDPIVRDAAEHHLALLPMVLAAPKWDGMKKTVYHGFGERRPKKVAPYANFMKDLVNRYGPEGQFWNENPSLPYRPIRRWQIWNEPNYLGFWDGDLASYTKLLRASYRAIKQTDSGTQVILAGLTNTTNSYSWDALDTIYKEDGKGYFDVVAAQPFSTSVDGVYTILKRMRRVMRKNHDGGRSMYVTETSWPSSQGKVRYIRSEQGFSVTEQQQAKNVAALYKLLAKKCDSLHLIEVDWYTWISTDRGTQQPFDYSGLSAFQHGKIRRKPGLKRLAKTALGLEHCKTKTYADACSS
ncbi:MAG: hypothetical protein JOZ25_05040 [Actinobacteria bacterium]|nr:hypothetical protein [Actinomycetota bacterium]